MNNSQSRVAGHNALKIRLFELLQEEKIKFIDQFGVVHNVYDSNEDFLYMETPYFYKTKDISLQGNYNKCVDSALNKEKFKPLCKNKSTDTVSRLCEKCSNCSKAFIGYEYSTFDGVLIPDISTGLNGKYKYWIEVVHSHASTNLKRHVVNNHKINCIEISLNALYDGYYEDDGLFVVDCYYVTNLNDDEYLKIKEALKIESRIYDMKLNLEDILNISHTKKPFGRFDLNYSKKKKSIRRKDGFNLMSHPFYRELDISKDLKEIEKEEMAKSCINLDAKDVEAVVIYEFLKNLRKTFFDKMLDALQQKGIAFKDVSEYLLSMYKQTSENVDDTLFNSMLEKYLRKELFVSIIKADSPKYCEKKREKYSIPNDSKVIVTKEICKIMLSKN